MVGAFGNVSGRILSGWLSDIMGRLNTLRVVLAMSSVAMPALYWVGAHLAALYVLIFVVYFCYGAQASVIPTTVSDFWGTRHAGANYGSIFTAWGFSGILGPTIGGVLFDKYRDYGVAFYTAAALVGSGVYLRVGGAGGRALVERARIAFRLRLVVCCGSDAMSPLRWNRLQPVGSAPA